MIWKAYNGPAPKEPLLETRTHPDNHQPYRRPRPLTQRQRANAQKQLDRLQLILDDIDYFNTLAAIRSARIEGRHLVEQLNQLNRSRIHNRHTTREQDIQELKDKLAYLKRFLHQKTSLLAPFRDSARQYHQLKTMLEADREARLEHASQADLEQEAHEFEAILIATLTRLNFCHRTRLNGKEMLEQVRFSRIETQPDKLYFKIAISRRQPFGYENLLPRGVRAANLVSQPVTAELSIACQRQVYGEITPHNGAWLILNRLNSAAALPDYLNYQKALATYPTADRPRMPIPAGVVPGNLVHWIYLDEHPHILLGGSTGGGKSNLLNLIICTLIQNHSPEEVNFVLIDLKEGLEFKLYQDIPHLLLPIITELDGVAHVLEQLETLRQQRMALLARHRVRDIDAYNAARPPGQRLPHIFVIFDEYASIHASKAYKTRIERAVLQLLNKARAASIKLIVSTQHPSVHVVPGHLKTNFTLRIATRMPTRSASTTILGSGAAADLPATKGRAILMLGSDKLELQTPHVTGQAIHNAIQQARTWTAPAPGEHLELPPVPDSRLFTLTEQTIIETALTHFGGALKKKPLWMHLAASGAAYDLISTLVNAIVSRQSIPHDGVTYTATRMRGNFYKLVPVASPEKENLL